MCSPSRQPPGGRRHRPCRCELTRFPGRASQRTARTQPRHGWHPSLAVTITALALSQRSAVTENDSPHSGSRWEPGATPQPDAARSWPPPQVPAEVVADPPPARARSGRRRAAVAVAAVGLVSAGGLGGFVIGQASSGNATTDTGVVQNGVPGQGGTEDGVPEHFPRDGGRGPRPDVGGSPTAPDGSDQGTGSTDDQSTT